MIYLNFIAASIVILWLLGKLFDHLDNRRVSYIRSQTKVSYPQARALFADKGAQIYSIVYIDKSRQIHDTLAYFGYDLDLVDNTPIDPSAPNSRVEYFAKFRNDSDRVIFRLTN